MNIKTYLLKKYGCASTLSGVEARVFGIPYPPKKGWLAKYGHMLVTEHMADQLLSFMRHKGAKYDTAKNALYGAGFQMPSVKVAIPNRKEIKARQAKQDAKLSNNDLSAKWQANKVNPASDAFLETYEWRRVRMEALKKYGARCQCCGATAADGVRINVDHIKPRKLFPHLALSLQNLQVLCSPCNHGKGNWDMTDWRDAEPTQEVQLKDVKLRIF
jgi:5-methylcytosine-specific restriction endonuclease McrA